MTIKHSVPMMVIENSRLSWKEGRGSIEEREGGREEERERGE